MANQYLNAILFITLFLSGCIAVTVTQSAGGFLKYIAPSAYANLISRQKRSFATLLMAVSQIFTRTRVQLFLPPSIEITTQANGNPRLSWKRRAVVIANHQLYNDWIYAWWLTYTADIHQAPVILLKEAIRRIPVFGRVALPWNFIYMARKWDIDAPRIEKTMKVIRAHPERPAWVLMFPEGTVTSANTVQRSRAYAEKSGITPLKNLLIPRIRGLQACLDGLDGAIETLYDLTIYYDGIPEGTYGEDFYSLGRMYFKGLYPKIVRIHVREFAVKDIPTDDERFSEWLLQVWQEKDRIFETLRTSSDYTAEYPVRLNSCWWELFSVYSFPLALASVLVAVAVRARG